MTSNKEFTITQDHLKLLQHAYIGWCDDEYGAPQIDPKRPYGNSFVEGDIAFILGWPIFDEELSREQYDRADEIHEETQAALQIILATLPDVTGTYVKEKEYFNTSWRKK